MSVGYELIGKEISQFSGVAPHHGEKNRWHRPTLWNELSNYVTVTRCTVAELCCRPKAVFTSHYLNWKSELDRLRPLSSSDRFRIWVMWTPLNVTVDHSLHTAVDVVVASECGQFLSDRLSLLSRSHRVVDGAAGVKTDAGWTSRWWSTTAVESLSS